MEVLGRNPQDIKMYPTVWNFVGDLASCYIYDLIDDKTTKDRIQTMINRLRDEDGNLAHDYSELLEDYRQSLLKVFSSDEIVMYFLNHFGNLVESYPKIILEEQSFVSEAKGEYLFWEEFIYAYHESFKKWYEYTSKKFNFLIPSNHLEILFPFVYEKSTTPFNEAIAWILQLTRSNKREFAREIQKDPDQLSSAVTKVQRWTKSKRVPNYASVIQDLTPLLDSMIEEHRLGIEITLYFSIALSRMFKIHLSGSMAYEIQGMLTFNQEQMNEAFSDMAKAQKAEQTEYLEKLYNPFKIMLENAFTDVLSTDQKLSALVQFIELNQEYIKKYHAEVFINFVKARIYYIDNEYEKATEYYLQAFDLGRYRIGRKIKVLIYELLYCCRKTGNIKLFKRVHNWQSFIIDQREYQLFSSEEKPFAQVWDDYEHSGKFVLLRNHRTGKVYS